MKKYRISKGDPKFVISKELNMKIAIRNLCKAYGHVVTSGKQSCMCGIKRVGA